LEVITVLDFKKLFQKNVELEEEEGQGLVEYALILFLVAVVVIAILIILGPKVGSIFSAVTKGLS
jgi:pilus assembly protein Flp/PilA